MTAAELIIRYLEELGVEYIFGVPGGAIEPLYSAIDGSSRIRAVTAKHEQGAAFMADGYARVTGRLGVCCATTGPGSTNLITGIASAYTGSVPLLVITAQVPTKMFGKGALQESTYAGVDIVEIFRKFTKYSAMIIRPEKTGEMLREALRHALSGRKGPVHLNIPVDVMGGLLDDEVQASRMYIPGSRPFDLDKVKKAADLIMDARRPAILIGYGGIVSGAVDEMIKLSELMSIPVATTPKAKGGFPTEHEFALGVFGLAGSPRAEAYLLDGRDDSGDARVDVLIAIGTRFNEWASNAWDVRLAPEKALIQIDINPSEFGKNYPFGVDLLGDAKTVVSELYRELSGRIEEMHYIDRNRLLNRLGERQKRIRSFKGRIEKYVDGDKMSSSEVPLKPQRLMKDLRESLPDDTLFFVDIGNNLAWATHYLDIRVPYTFYAGLGFASMGFGVAAAVGAKLAFPGRTVVAIAGDGGFLMNGMEVATAVNHEVQVIWVILNNAQLGMVAHCRRLLNIPYRIGEEFKEVDFVRIAEGLGARGVRVTEPGEINAAMMREVISTGEPTVIDVIVDRNETPPLGARIDALKKAKC